ncbi:MAG: hypothetical protein V1676_07125 [Candidatus Diapherotrites archaeon]
MRKDEVLSALRDMRDASAQRKFRQSVDLTINFRGIDFRKPENAVDVDVSMPNATGKQSTGKAVVFVRDKDFAHKLKGRADRIVLESEIAALKKNDVDDIIRNYSVLLAEGPVMLTVAKHLGQQLAPKGKMPRPITPDMNTFEDAISGMSSSVKVTTKKGKSMPLVHVNIGKEDMQDEKLAENVMAVYGAIVPALKEKEQSVKSVYVKLTMGPAVKVGSKSPVEKQEKKSKKTKIKEETAAEGSEGQAKTKKHAPAEGAEKTKKHAPAEGSEGSGSKGEGGAE